MQLTASKPAIYASCVCHRASMCHPRTEGSRQLIFWLVRSMRALIVLLITCGTALCAPHYTDAMFRRAMAQYNASVTDSGRPLPAPREGTAQVRTGQSPLYVLITLKDPKTGEQRELCVGNEWLHSAIAIEHRLDVFDDQRKIFDIAMAARDRVFTFTKRKARESLGPAYTPEQLEYVRRLLAGKSHRWLLQQAQVGMFKRPNQQGFVTRIYRREIGKKLWSSYPLRVAVAHALLERGILVGEAHYGGMLGVLYIDEKA